MRISAITQNLYTKPIGIQKKNNRVYSSIEKTKELFLYPHFGQSTAFSPAYFLNEIKYENAEKEYYNGIKQNQESIAKLSQLEHLLPYQQVLFISEFCKQTGFPNFNKIKEKAENEITNSIYSLADEQNFDVKFIGYDKNSSLGRNLALPGSDCDALFYIIDPKENKEPWFSGAIRWQLKDRINQRVLCTHAGGLPEVLPISYIEEGLELANSSFEKCKFTSSELSRFNSNLTDDTNDFVKSAEFNIKLAKQIPNDGENRTKYYKTAMLCELIRSGIILENNLGNEITQKIKQSPLYQYSNLMKQDGLSCKLKQKHKLRQQMAKDFPYMPTDRQFSIVKDLIRTSFMLPTSKENEEYFSNYSEMGNIVEMYNNILN